jgi:hypothetical protein
LMPNPICVTSSCVTQNNQTTIISLLLTPLILDAWLFQRSCNIVTLDIVPSLSTYLCLFFYPTNTMATCEEQCGPAKPFVVVYFKDLYFRARLWQELYGFKFPILHLLACSQVWCMAHQLLRDGERNDNLFEIFRDSQGSECSAVALAVGVFC